MITKSNQKKPCSGVSTMQGLSRWPDTGASCRRKEFRQDGSTVPEGSRKVNSYIRRRKRLVHMQYTCTTHIYHKDQRKLADTSMPELPPMGMSSVFLTRCCLIVLILTAALTTACCLTLEQSNSSGTQSIVTVKGLDGGQGNVSQQASTDGSYRSSYQINGQQQFKNQSIKQSEQEVAKPSLGANELINNDKSASTPLSTSSSPRVKILDSKAATEVVTNQLAPSALKDNQRQLVAGKFGSDNQLDTSSSAVGGNDDKLQPQSTQLVSSTTTELSPFLGSDSGQDEVMLAADSKKKKKMMKKKKKMEKKHKEWKKGKKHKKKKYESKKKKGGMEKKKKGKKEKKKWGMEKKGHKKKGNFKKKKWGHKKKMKKGHKKGKKGHKMLKDKGHKKKGFKKVYHKEEWGKKKKWHDIKREKKWNTKQKKWKKKWHQEKGKKYKGKHMKKYHKKNKHGKKYKKEKKSKWKKHKGEKYKKGHKKKKEEYSKKKEGGKKKKMKKMKKEMKKKKG